MAKMLKQLVFGQKKNPPAPPRPDYEGDKSSTLPYTSPTDSAFFDHDYENIPKLKCQIKFSEKKEAELVVFDNYSEPADLRVEMSTLEADPLYMSPLDDRGTAPPLPPEEEEDMYCVPYDTPEEETAPPLPQPSLVQGRFTERNSRVPEPHPAREDATYDVVPEDDDDPCATRDDTASARSRPVPEDEYDEPWEWSVGARLTNSLQVSPAPSLEDDDISAEDNNVSGEDEDMTARQQRRLVYETAFDSRVKERDAADDLEGLMLQQGSPLFLNRAPLANDTVVARAASRSSFGSTSGSSASSTPTHQPMGIARQSPRHFTTTTPTERRKVTLVRDGLPRSMSPQGRTALGRVVNRNFERKISFSSAGSNNSNPWDSVSRCSGSSDKSSSQESMNVEVSSGTRNPLGRSASRDSLNERRNVTCNYPNNWKELTTAKLTSSSSSCETNADDFHGKGGEVVKDEPTSFGSKKAADTHPGVKVLPTDVVNSPHFSKTKSSKSCDLDPQDPELKENNSQMAPSTYPQPPHMRRSAQRPSSLLSEVRPMDNLPQSPENDNRSGDDYDPPWDLKVVNSNNVSRPSGVNGSMSVPERLSSSGGVGGCQTQLPTSVTHDKLDAAEEAKDGPMGASKPNRPNGPLSRPNLNLNLSSDSPRKARQSLSLNFGCAALTAVGEKVDPQLTLEKQGWYHGSISRVDAEGKLRVLKEGSYLVRNSESSKQDYSLSLRSARGFMHMKIVPTSEGRFILGQFSNPFSSIPEMIQHYSVNKLPIKGAEHMSLLYPVIDQLL